LAETKVFSGF